MWRLATTINYLSEKVFALGREQEVEIVVADWGSFTPIAEVLELTAKGATISRFLHIPWDLAEELQDDSPFAEVYALNAAARVSKGLYVGRIDQDTLVTEDFLFRFFNTYEGKSKSRFDLHRSYMFAARKQLPYAFVKREPTLIEIDKCIRRFRNWIFNEELKFCHWASPVGILMMHRDMWEDLGGYDERLIYYWFMDVDLGTRLIKKYPIVNIGKVFGYDFFHLEHIRSGFRFRHSHRKLNPDWSKSFDKPILNPNGENWGLKQYNLQITRSAVEPIKHDSNTEKVYANQVALLSKIVWGSLRRWAWYQVKHLWYLSKKIRKKPYL
ncbi:hypothetical protein EV198_2902 [Roseivirga ehrenbergii]|nr:hypothetical protein EV198_2902 [Roseivirga ehrenbergii]